MKILIVSDIHDNVTNLLKIVHDYKGKVDSVINLGDTVAPPTALLLEELEVPIHAVFGNNDGDKFLLTTVCKNTKWYHDSVLPAIVEINGVKFAISHYERCSLLALKAGECDVALYGHDHTKYSEKIGDKLLLNPGAVCGYKGKKVIEATVALYDTTNRTYEILEL